MQRLACGRRMYEVIITLYCHMSLRPQNDGGDDDDDRSTTNQTNKQYTNTQRNKQASKQSSLPHTTNTILGLLHLKFFPDFFYDFSLHSDKRPPQRGPYGLCSPRMIGLRGLWLGALRGPWPVQPMKTRGLWPMTSLRGLWLGGAARPVACAGDEYASVGSITADWKPVASAAGPITESRSATCPRTA